MLRSSRPLRAVRPFAYSPPCRRQIFNLFRRKFKAEERSDPVPLISEDNLFHPFSKSPFAHVRARGQAIQSLAPCPVCTPEQSKTVKFECPDCGWPTHCSQEHWQRDSDHEKYCSRLREANEDEHDLRSGRRMWEFELPGIFVFLF